MYGTVFSTLGALMEYAVILFLLKTRRKPLRTIDQGFKHLFEQHNGSNGEVQFLNRHNSTL